MASNADGSVTLDFSINTDDLSKEIDNANKSVEKFTQNTQKNMEKSDQAIEEAKEYLEALDKEAKKVNQEYNFVVNIDGIEDAENDLKYFQREGEETLKEIIEMKKALKDAERDFGDYSEQAILMGEALDKLKYELSINTKNQQDLQKAIDKAKKAKKEAAKITAEYGTSAKDAGEKTEKLGESTEKAGNSMKDGEKAIGSFQIALGNLISRVISKAIDGMVNLANSTRDLRKEMAMLETSAQASGVSIEVAKQAMKDLNLVADGTDSALEATSNLLASGFDENGLADAVNVLSGAVIKFPDTMKIESLADGLQETLKTKEATGQYAELLNRMGINLESYNDTIKDMTDAEAREYSLQILRSRGLENQTQLYKAQNKELVDASNAQWDLNQAMAEIGEVLEPLQTEIMQEITQLIMENKDAIVSITENLASLAEMIFGVIKVLGSIPAPVWIVIGSIVTLISAFLTIYKTVKEVSGAFGLFGKGLGSFDTQALKTTAIIFGVLAALIVLAAIIAVISGQTNDLDRAMNSVGNSVGKIQDNINSVQNGGRIRGHAKGTESARRGWSWVGEKGPELMYLSGGEKILTASQSMAMGMVASRGAGQSYSQTINISVNGIGQLDEIVKWYTTRRQMERAR